MAALSASGLKDARALRHKSDSALRDVGAVREAFLVFTVVVRRLQLSLSRLAQKWA